MTSTATRHGTEVTLRRRHDGYVYCATALCQECTWRGTTYHTGASLPAACDAAAAQGAEHTSRHGAG